MVPPAERGGRGRPAGARGPAGARRDAPAGAPARVRIVGGLWKRTPLAVIDAPGLRPTPDRVRETLFNWLGQHLEGWRCLDLYAGTGALGFEAASRGAARVVLVERDARAVAALREVKGRLHAEQVEVVQADAPAFLAGLSERFDLVFLDPPFASDALARVLPAVAAVLAPGAAVYVESDRPLDPAAAPLSGVPSLVLQRADRAGQVHYHLLRLNPRTPGA